jgi:hypothetical protein
MVKVLPEPVCPYAKMVPLKPSTVRLTMDLATLSKTCKKVGHHEIALQVLTVPLKISPHLAWLQQVVFR